MLPSWVENLWENWSKTNGLVLKNVSFVAKGWSSEIYKLEFENHVAIAAKVSIFKDEPFRQSRFTNEKTMNEFLTTKQYEFIPKYYTTLVHTLGLVHLHEFLETQIMDVNMDSAMAYIKIMAEALGQLNNLQVVHCDLQLGNIGYENGCVKICDWEFGKINYHDRLPPIGYVPYMSPEYFDPNLPMIMNKIDIYAFGSGLFKLLTGEFFLGNVNKVFQDAACNIIKTPYIHTLVNNIEEAYAKLSTYNFPTVYHQILIHTLNPNPILRWSPQQLKTFVTP